VRDHYKTTRELYNQRIGDPERTEREKGLRTGTAKMITERIIETPRRVLSGSGVQKPTVQTGKRVAPRRSSISR